MFDVSYETTSSFESTKLVLKLIRMLRTYDQTAYLTNEALENFLLPRLKEMLIIYQFSSTNGTSSDVQSVAMKALLKAVHLSCPVTNLTHLASTVFPITGHYNAQNSEECDFRLHDASVWPSAVRLCGYVGYSLS